MKKSLCFLTIVLAVSSSVFATDIPGNAFKFTLAGGADIANGSQVTVAPGSSVKVSVWAAPTQGVTAVKTLVAWDTSLATKDGKLSGSVFTDVINPSLFNTSVQNIAGQAGTGASGASGYGSYFAASLQTGSTTNFADWTKIGDVTITNNGATIANPYPVKLYNRSGSASGFDSAIVAGLNSYSPVVGSEPSFTIVPEPISMVLLAIGGLFISRRKMA